MAQINFLILVDKSLTDRFDWSRTPDQVPLESFSPAQRDDEGVMKE